MIICHNVLLVWFVIAKIVKHCDLDVLQSPTFLEANTKHTIPCTRTQNSIKRQIVNFLKCGSNFLWCSIMSYRSHQGHAEQIPWLGNVFTMLPTSSLVMPSFSYILWTIFTMSSRLGCLFYKQNFQKSMRWPHHFNWVTRETQKKNTITGENYKPINILAS